MYFFITSAEVSVPSDNHQKLFHLQANAVTIHLLQHLPHSFASPALPSESHRIGIGHSDIKTARASESGSRSRWASGAGKVWSVKFVSVLLFSSVYHVSGWTPN